MHFDIFKGVVEGLIKIFIPNNNGYRTPKWVLDKKRRDKKRKKWAQHVAGANKKNIAAYKRVMKASPKYRKIRLNSAQRTWKVYRQRKIDKSTLLK